MIHEQWSRKVGLQFCSQVLRTLDTRREAQKPLQCEGVDYWRILDLHGQEFELACEQLLTCDQVIRCDLAFHFVLAILYLSLFGQ